tara:strand:- start:15460 stop:16239 length:780 start_codon:yes stop_codon:yes gene_type:complete
MKDTLVLGGGGLLGICILGALDCLFGEYEQSNFKNICGTSVGALIGLLLCFKTPFEIYEIMLTQNLFQEENLDFVDFFTEFGFIKHDLIRNELSKHIPENITFEELYTISQKHLCIVGTNLTLQCCELFDYKKTPDMKIVDAVCISLSVPFVFQKYNYNDCIYIDGCVTLNFPWNVFDVEESCKLGVKVKSTSKTNDEMDLLHFAQSVISTLVNESYEERGALHIDIDFPYMKEYTPGDVIQLYKSGNESAYNWLKKLK